MQNEQTRGLLITLSGPSGSGKGTIVKSLLSKRADTVLSVSATTRAPREGEIDGVHYHFIDRETFLRMIEDNAFLEYAEYNGNFYGTPKAPVEAELLAGHNVLLEIEVQGAEKVMDSGAEMVSIFITIPSMQELERRLRGRDTETEETILSRLSIAERELKRAFRYDYVVLNDDVDAAVERIETIIQAENMRYSRMSKTVMEVLEVC
ncbi:MAG: guanylate kinase [Ruminococcaceae bacterium]|nr:guanylate kinase [Oscillospiraceae bacterium]